MRLTRKDRILLFAPITVLLTGGLLLPAVIGLAATFTNYSPFSSAVHFSGLSNYAAVLGDHVFVSAVRNIGVFTVAAVPLELLIGFALAYVLRNPVRGRSLWRVLLLMPWLVSPIANGVMWHFLFDSTRGVIDFALGWLGQQDLPSPLGDARLALATTVAVEVWRTAPLVTFLLLPGLSAIYPERWEDAVLNGASWHRRVLDVALPSIWPLLLATTMLLIGLALGTFDSVLILTGGGPGTSTITPALYSYYEAFSANDWPAGATSAWIVAAGVLGVGLIYLRLALSRTTD